MAFLRTGCEDREYSFAEVFLIFLIFLIFFFLSSFAEKSLLSGVKIFFRDYSKKKGHPGLLFLIFWQVLE